LGCLDGYLDCSKEASDGCEIDPTTDVAHCAGCGKACTVAVNGSPVCVDGKCGAQCDAGYLECDGDPANGCEASVIVYEDKDQDRVGIAAKWKEACAPSPGWASKIGDCDDDDPDVYPGQQNWFSKPSAKKGFDYNARASCPASSSNGFSTLGGGAGTTSFLRDE
jgi:hypothetical protein